MIEKAPVSPGQPLLAPGERLRQAFLFVTVIAVFWGAVDHAPRADQHMVLFQFQRYSGVVELFRETVSWPRSVLKADIHLFRPLGNLFMALQWALFGYLFPLYQAVGIVLHAAAALLLYRLAAARLGVPAWLALGGALAFAFYPMSSEAVLWHTLNQMALWAVLVLLGLDRYLASAPERRASLGAFLFLVLAALTIDQGVVLLGLALQAALAFAWGRWISAASPAVLRAAASNLALALLGFALVVVLNFADLYRTGWTMADLLPPAGSISEPLLPQPFFVLRFWLAPFLLPALYTFGASSRMGVWYSLSSWPLVLANLADALLFLALGGCVLWALSRRWRVARRGGVVPVDPPWHREPWIAPAIAALGFVALFVLGRGASRGASVALNNGLHASYPFMVMFTLAALGFLASRMASLPRGWSRAGAILATLAFAVLAGLQAHSLGLTIDRFTRHGAGDMAVYRAVMAAYAATGETEAPRFTVAFRQPCDINYPLRWFHDGMTIAEAAFPRWYRADAAHLLDCPVAAPAQPVAVRASVAGTTPARRLFDGVSVDDSFFRAAAWPVSVEAVLARPLRLTAYRLGGGQHAWGMPRAWRVWSADAAGGPVLLDEQRGASPWQRYEVREFALAARPVVGALRFEFLDGAADGLLLYEIELLPE